VQREQHRAGVVVDRQRVLGAGQLPERPHDKRVALASLAGFQVDLEVTIPFQRARGSREERGAQRRTARSRMQYYAGRVYDALELHTAGV
jgi:hypothetical protein